MPKLEKLFEPIKIGKVELKNRVVFVATDTSSATSEGEVTERMILNHEMIARGGTGFIIVGAATPDSQTGKPTVTATALDNDSFIPSLNELAEAMKENGAKCAIQIQHPGRQAATPAFAQVAPSDIVTQQEGSAGHERVYAGRRLFKIARALTIEEIYELIDKFAEAAWRAQQAGFDAVELHGAHGYLIAQFMSSATNHRIDRFGGSLENRLRFPLEIIAAIKDKCGLDFPVLIRYSADEFVPNGRKLEESVQIAKVFEKAGIAALDVSCGTFDSPWPTMDIIGYPQGWRAYMAEEIKKAVKVPVITVGSIRDPEVAERILVEGKADLIGLSRQLLADPDWAIKAQEGRFDDIRKCISCLIGCWQESLLAKTRCRCSVNPVMGNEKKFFNIIKSEKPKNVMIVGGGPGGMEAARVAALRGHNVSIYEKEDELGGQLRMCCTVPGKDKNKWAIDWLRVQVKKLSNINVNLNSNVNVKLVEKEKPNAIIIATGAENFRPEIPGINLKNTILFSDVLKCSKKNCEYFPEGRKIDTVKIGEKVVIWGNGWASADTAEVLSRRGKDVTVITEDDIYLPDMEPITRSAQMMFFSGTPVPGLGNKPPKYPVNVMTSIMVRQIIDKGISVINMKTMEEKVIEADNIIIAKTRPREINGNGLGNVLKKFVPEIYLIGDCAPITTPNAHYNVKNAMYSGHRVAHLI